MKRVDHVTASREFLADEQHVEFHDKRLWTLRTLRDEAAHGIEEWEQLRSLASGIKEHTLTHLAGYLEEFERNAACQRTASKRGGVGPRREGGIRRLAE